MKETKDQAGYQGPDQGPFHCGHCRFFRNGNACTKVQGVIDPYGCCNEYKKANDVKVALKGK